MTHEIIGLVVSGVVLAAYAVACGFVLPALLTDDDEPDERKPPHRSCKLCHHDTGDLAYCIWCDRELGGQG